MKKINKKKTLLVLGCILVIAVIQTLPIFFLKPMGSEVMTDKNIQLYYAPGEEKGAEEVFHLLQLKSAEIRAKLKMDDGQSTKVYLYKSQNQLAIREAGFITLTFAPSWYIGDSHKGNIMIVSPYTEVEGHTHESILNATLHELVHSINYQINPNISYFWDNGLATYLSSQKPDEEEIINGTIPTFEQMQTDNGLEFSAMGGYAFSYEYIEYLEENYGWDKVVAYAAGEGSYEEIFDKSELNVYKDWQQALQQDLQQNMQQQRQQNGSQELDEMPAYLEQTLSEMVSEGRATGVVVSVADGEGDDFTTGYGFADKELGIPVDGNQTGFRIGSISKTFVAVAALQMAEKNKLDMDAPISRYLPEDFPPFEEKFTMKQLLTHSAGFEDILSGIAVYDVSKAEPLEISIRKYRPNQIYSPGDISSYSNYGIALAAYVVQRVSGEEFSKYANENIFKPLHLYHTSFELDFKGVNISKAYAPSGEETTEPYMNIYPEGSVISTGEDMNRYMHWMMEEGDSILGESGKEELFKQQYASSSEHNGMGYIWNIRERNKALYYDKKGETLNFYSRVMICPKTKTGVFISFNNYVDEETLNGMMNQLTDLMLGAAEPPEKYEGEQTADISGNYITTTSNFQTVEKVMNLILNKKEFQVTGNLKQGFQMNGEDLYPLGENYYNTPLGKLKFKEIGEKSYLTGSGSDSYVRRSWFESSRTQLLNTGIFILFAFVGLMLAVFRILNRKNDRLKGFPVILSLLNFGILAGVMVLVGMGIINFNITGLEIFINILGMAIVLTTLAGMASFLKKIKRKGAPALKWYLAASSVSGILFCLWMVQVNMIL